MRHSVASYTVHNRVSTAVDFVCGTLLNQYWGIIPIYFSLEKDSVCLLV